MRTESGQDWLLWQLADSAFPSGGFVHSFGLEAAWQCGQINGPGELAEFIEAAVRQQGYASLPFFNDAFDQPEDLAQWDSSCDAFLAHHVANRASRAQGRAFLASVRRIFPVGAGVVPPRGHFAPVFGWVAQALEIRRRDAARLFLFQHLRGLVAAAVRLGLAGPMEGQSMQHKLASGAREVLLACGQLRSAEAAQTAPLLEIWQGAQDRLYSRLFQS